jgi:hypothetical protein
MGAIAVTLLLIMFYFILGFTGWSARIRVPVAVAMLLSLLLGVFVVAQSVSSRPTTPAAGLARQVLPTPLNAREAAGLATAKPAAQSQPSTQGGPAPTREDRLREYFSSDAKWLSAELGIAPAGSQTYCGLEVLGSSPTAQQLYVWVSCERYGASAGSVSLLSGAALPVLVAVAGTGSSTRVTGWTVPPDGAGYAAWIRLRFPKHAAGRAINQQVDPQPTSAQLASQAAKDLLPRP